MIISRDIAERAYKVGRGTAATAMLTMCGAGLASVYGPRQLTGVATDVALLCVAVAMAGIGVPMLLDAASRTPRYADPDDLAADEHLAAVLRAAAGWGVAVLDGVPYTRDHRDEWTVDVSDTILNLRHAHLFEEVVLVGQPYPYMLPTEAGYDRLARL